MKGEKFYLSKSGMEATNDKKIKDYPLAVSSKCTHISTKEKLRSFYVYF